jgi:hypothetical protein
VAKVAPVVSVRGHGVVLAVAGLLMLAGVMAPWAFLRDGSQGSSGQALGIAFTEGTWVAGLSLLLLVAGWRLASTRRRWMAIALSSVGWIGAAGGLGVAMYELLRFRERVSGFGLFAVIGAGLLGLAAAYGALRRLRGDLRRWDRPPVRLR